MAAYSGFNEKTPLFAAFCFEYSELILHFGIKLGLDVIVSE